MRAAELISEIRQVAAKLMQAEREAFGQHLFLAIELGTLLSQAKADPDVGAHGEWEAWFKAQKFDFSLRKAQRCMRYAKKKRELLAAAKTPRVADLAANDLLSIRDAEALLKKKPKPTGKASKSPGAKAQSEQQTKPRPVTTDEQARVEQARAEAEAAKARERAAKAEAERAKHERKKAEAEARRAREQARYSRDNFFSDFFGRSKKIEIHSGRRTLLVKALGMLGSVHDNEVLVAARKAEDLRKKLNMTWDQLIVEAKEEIDTPRQTYSRQHTAASG
jgi:hypothetical protein